MKKTLGILFIALIIAFSFSALFYIFYRDYTYAHSFHQGLPREMPYYDQRIDMEIDKVP